MTDYNNQNHDNYSESMDQGYATYEIAQKPPEPKPVITYALLGINILLFALMELAGGSTNDAILTQFGAKDNILLWSGEYWRLITPIFLHIGPTHLLLNSWSLYVFGPVVEKVFGSIKFLFIYLIAGLTGSIMSVIMTPNLSAGASGAIFGLMGALLYFSFRYREVINRHFVINLLLVIGFNIYFGFTNEGIDNYAHLGGLFGGLMTSAVLGSIHESFLSRLRITFGIVWIAILIGLTALSLQPNENDPQWNFLQGNKAFSADNYPAAILYYQKVIKKFPQSEKTHFNLGLAYIKSKQIPKARMEMQTVLKLNPENQRAAAILQQLSGKE